jgi:hypothetical protein
MPTETRTADTNLGILRLANRDVLAKILVPEKSVAVVVTMGITPAALVVRKNILQVTAIFVKAQLFHYLYRESHLGPPLTPATRASHAISPKQNLHH